MREAVSNAIQKGSILGLVRQSDQLLMSPSWRVTSISLPVSNRHPGGRWLNASVCLVNQTDNFKSVEPMRGLLKGLEEGLLKVVDVES